MRHLITACCIAFAAPAAADVTLVYQDESGAPAYTLSVKGQKLRLEMHDEEGHVTLFDGAKEEMTVLQSRKREYVVMDRPTVERVQAQMRQALQMMERFGMDPAAMGLGGKRVDGRVVQTGDTRTVGGHRCNVMNYVVDDEVETISCVAPPARVGISDADWTTIRGMFEMMVELTTEMLPDGMFGIEFPPMDGVLIETSDGDGGNRQLLSRVDTAALADDRFTVPPGWKRTSLELPEMPGRR